jgi:hypothetical protein
MTAHFDVLGTVHSMTFTKSFDGNDKAKFIKDIIAADGFEVPNGFIPWHAVAAVNFTEN